MATLRPFLRPASCCRFLQKQSRLARPQRRCYAVEWVQERASHETPPPPSKAYWWKEALEAGNYKTANRHKRAKNAQLPLIKVPKPPPSTRAVCKEPLKVIDAAQITLLDPSGARTRLFAKSNPDAAHVGDILLVRQRSGEPFAGVCINIRRRGVETGILLRGQLTRIGVEMWFKIYSPNVEAIEVVQRAKKRARRARLYYMRTPKHDVGSVEGIVRQYTRQRALLGKRGSARIGSDKRKKR